MTALIVDVCAQVARRVPAQHIPALLRIVSRNSMQGNASFVFLGRGLWMPPSFLAALSCISVLLQHLPPSDTRQSLLCSAWVAIGTAVLCKEPGVLVQLREMTRVSSWVVAKDLQEWITQEEASARVKDVKPAAVASSPTVSAFAATVASPIDGTGTRRASSIALAGLTASPSNVNQSIKRRLSVAQMSSLSSSGGGGAGSKDEDTLEMQRFWRFCDAMLCSFGEEAVLDAFL
jgi:hypothetical protein